MGDAGLCGEAIRVTGTVQGVGFRPHVWQLAQACRLRGRVWNDARGVLIHAWGRGADLAAFRQRLWAEPPPLARIADITCTPLAPEAGIPADFHIVASRGGGAQTAVAPDAATCPACLAEVREPGNRRYRYPFTNCTHCGPRLSIVRAIPYDRANTSMAAFALCPACRREYEDPADRRFHAQPNACPACGPRVWLEDALGGAAEVGGARDAIDAARRLIQGGAIVAIKGIGGFHLACDAANGQAVERLRRRKHRHRKAFALLARDVAMVRRYAAVSDVEQTQLVDGAAPIVVLDARGEMLPAALAPGQHSLGCMLPYSPLHHLLMQDMPNPIVLTSGNRSDEPQCVANEEARRRLQGIADYFLLHDRDIVNRLDDSVVRVAAGEPRLLRRARGHAPAPLALPAGFEATPPLLAMGGELKNTFCLLRDGQAILSQHLGDLEDAATLREYRHTLALYRQLFDHRPEHIAVDRHPDYLSSQWGTALAQEQGVPRIAVQHHHAHIAAGMAEHGLPRDTPPVLGIALDGLGLGEDGSLWGGEFLLCDYRGFRRLARFQPVAMPGGAQAIREPWRNTYAQLACNLGWEAVRARYPTLDLVRFLDGQPLATLATLLARGINSPPASSCGRLFDAVAAALGLCRESSSHEGQAAMELEALAAVAFADEEGDGYPYEIGSDADGLFTLGWRPLWESLLRDLDAGTEDSVIAARFHRGLARAVVEAALRLCRRTGCDTLVLGGGVFQNRLLLEAVSRPLGDAGLHVLAPRRLPANDGGLSLGQAVVAAARVLAE